MLSQSSSPAVHVIDDDESFRTAMIRMLTSAGFRSIGYGCAGEFLLAASGEIAGCMLLDIVMPGPSGIDLLKSQMDRGLLPPVIFLTGRDDVDTSVEVMKSGAYHYLVKPVAAERIVPVIRRALHIDSQRRTKRRQFDALRRRADMLTSLEYAILRGIMHNRLNKQLAADLGASERTIKVHRARMMRKLQVSTLPELVRAARLLETGKDVCSLNGEAPLALCRSQQHPALANGCCT